MIREGNLIVSVDTTLGDLIKVTGYLCVYEGATLTAPRLISVGGLYVRKGATLTATQLTSVSEHLYVYEGATLIAPLLTSAYGQPGREIARCPDKGHVLWSGDNGLYYAGCRRELTREEALVHWSGGTKRAKLFTAAILSA